MLHRIKASFLIIFLLFACNIYGQVSSVGFQNLNIEDGLSHSLVTGIVEDDKGFLWISTQNG
ncbi:MAG: hypothetical protein KAG37_06505, partial [Flavobacteriales bacterium]|nr:hypothetical protein [Flavobacteriales bacterium]